MGSKKWEPIETAPKQDGPVILGYFPSRAMYGEDFCVVPMNWTEWGGGCWRNATNGGNIVGDTPTHWRPMVKGPFR